MLLTHQPDGAVYWTDPFQCPPLTPQVVKQLQQLTNRFSLNTEIHVSKASEVDTSQGTNAESHTPTTTIRGNAVDSMQTEQHTTNASSTLCVSSDTTNSPNNMSGDLRVSETPAVLMAKWTLTTTHGNSPDKIQIEGPSSDTPATLHGTSYLQIFLALYVVTEPARTWRKQIKHQQTLPVSK